MPTSEPVGIVGCGSYLPREEVPNEPVAAAAGVTADWIEAKTAIVARRNADPAEATSDLAARAGEDALRAAGIPASDVSVIIVATSTPDSPQPPTACLVQHALGAHRASAFDVNAVCSGFVYALDVGRRMVADGGYALVIGADIYSRILDPADRRTAILFGDGAGAVVLGPGKEVGVHGIKLASHGAAKDLIYVPGGGSRIPPSKESLLAGDHYFKMDGRGVREFVAREIPGAIQGFLADLAVDPAEIRHFVPHQANGRLITDLAERIDLPNARMHKTVERFGNTGAASVPITLAAARAEIAPGELVLLAAFGGGMSTGFALVSFS